MSSIASHTVSKTTMKEIDIHEFHIPLLSYAFFTTHSIAFRIVAWLYEHFLSILPSTTRTDLDKTEGCAERFEMVLLFRSTQNNENNCFVFTVYSYVVFCTYKQIVPFLYIVFLFCTPSYYFHISSTYV